MRYPQSHKSETRARILAAAGEAFRARGYAAVGVDEVMTGAGFTAGGFYRHFSSKQDLLAEALGASGSASRQGLLSGLEHAQGPALLRAVAARYLSRSHRDAPASGCPLPSLSAEVARSGEGPRAQVQGYLEALLREVSGRVPAGPGLSAEDRVLATAAVLVGGLLLARAVPDGALSERILRASRRLAVPELAAEAERARTPLAKAAAPRQKKPRAERPAARSDKPQPALRSDHPPAARTSEPPPASRSQKAPAPRTAKPSATRRSPR